MNHSDWDLDEKLVTGPTNGIHVNEIVRKTLVNSAYMYLTARYVWPRNKATKYIKKIHTQQYNYQKLTRATLALPLSKQEELKKRGLYNSRKTNVSQD